VSKLCAEDVPHPALRSHAAELVPSWAADRLDDGIVGHGAGVGGTASPELPSTLAATMGASRAAADR
jgi:hypothetical protein